jgi:hypothetical protein
MIFDRDLIPSIHDIAKVVVLGLGLACGFAAWVLS